MAEFLNFGGKIKLKNDQQYGEYPVVYSPAPNAGTIKEEPTSEGDGGECELVVYSPLPQVFFKEELEIEDDQIRINSEISVVSNAAPTVENIGFLQIVPGSVVSLAHQSPPATMEIDVTQIKMEKTDVESDIVQENYLIAYYPLPKETIKEEPHSRNGQNGWDFEKQLTAELEENLDSAPTTTCTLTDSSSTGDHRNETFQSIDLPRTSIKRKKAASKDDLIEPIRGANNRKRSQKSTALSANQGEQSLAQRPSTGRVHRSCLKGRSTLFIVDDGGTSGTRREKEELEKSHGKLKEQQKAARSIEAEEMSEHSSLEGMDSSDDGSTADDFAKNHSTANSSQQSKQRAIGKSLASFCHPEEKKESPFKCKNCGSSFRLKKYLKKHLVRTCEVQPKYSCKECGNRFKTKQHLQRHLMKVHNVEKSELASLPKIRPTLPFKCNKCGKTYKQKNGLTYHLTFTCGLSPCFPCTQCDYKAKNKSNLRSHLICVHNVDRSQFSAFGAAAPKARPEQPFKCEKCGRSYKEKKSLNKHLKFQCGVDPSFLCSRCGYRASQKGTLKQHIINVHADAGLPQLDEAKKL